MAARAKRRTTIPRTRLLLNIKLSLSFVIVFGNFFSEAWFEAESYTGKRKQQRGKGEKGKGKWKGGKGEEGKRGRGKGTCD